MTHETVKIRRLIAATAICLCPLWASCGDDATEPQPVPFNVTTAELTQAGEVVDDAHDRLADALTDQAFAGTLRPLLNTLNTHIAANRADRAEPAVTAVLQALNASAGTAPAGDAPDRAAILLSIAHIERLLAR